MFSSWDISIFGTIFSEWLFAKNCPVFSILSSRSLSLSVVVFDWQYMEEYAQLIAFLQPLGFGVILDRTSRLLWLIGVQYSWSTKLNIQAQTFG